MKKKTVVIILDFRTFVSQEYIVENTVYLYNKK